jgi:hypothetical protein
MRAYSQEILGNNDRDSKEAIATLRLGAFRAKSMSDEV